MVKPGDPTPPLLSRYANGGLNRRGATGNRGLDVLTLQRPDGTAFRTRRFHHMNPQTQEKFQSGGSGNDH